VSLLPAAVEVAAYRIAQEAIWQCEHANVRRVTVRLTHADNGLTVEIEDGRIGVAADTKGLSLAPLSSGRH
jgi:signal transduction histidine kinase